VCHARGLTGVGTDLVQVSQGLNRLLGAHTGLVFGVALLASGVASSSVGTLSGQVMMQGFVHRKVPVFVRRTVTMIPAVLLITTGFDPTKALVVSQVFLSLGIPFALIPLVMFTRDRTLMGDLVNRRLASVAAFLVSGIVVSLNVYLLVAA
jgi:manganese transport protein